MSSHDQTSRSARLLALAIIAVQGVALSTLASASAGPRSDGSDHHAVAPADPAAVQPLAAGEATPAAVTPTPATVPPAPTTPPPPSPPPPPALPAPQAAPAPPAPPPPPPPAPDPLARVQAAYQASVPAGWRAAITVRFELIDGTTSWAHRNGTIQIGRSHANGSEANLRATIAHEFGHLIAFGFGSQAYLGAAPEGWPPYSSRPEEAWADCVSRAFTGLDAPSHGLPACAGSSLSWTAGWVGQGPGAHPRTD